MHDSPLHDEIHCVTKIHCATEIPTKSTARQNPLRNEALYAARIKIFSAQLQMEMEIINENLPFETGPWRC